ncbi:hypothetical protein GCM10027445_48390 [Amycolatopsis endophytica]|uniref:Uncharacterized protein n=1 Tax=Amycolatopsis endophytica TaxID=860233 RepID=A0A853BDA7_9PSEU|nr:hypothetical protein [Amycolatopsis endophytica]NYI93353.1 hypothetical protein [Amycolatopsis endophytica]
MTSTTPGQQAKSRTATVNLPFVRAEFRTPDVHLPKIPVPDRDEVNAALHTARSFLPPPRQLAYFGGLGLLAAVELIEWPVAVAIGVGAAVVGRGKGDQKQQGDQKQIPAPAAATSARARAGTPKKGGTARGNS